MLHYYSLKFFGPLLLSPYLDGPLLNVFVVVDQIPTAAVRDPVSQRLRMEPVSAFRDILRSGVEREDALERTAEVARAINGVLTLEMYAWSSFAPLRRWTVPYQVGWTVGLLCMDSSQWGTADAEIKKPPCGSQGLSKVPSF